MIDEQLFRQEWQRGATSKHLSALFHVSEAAIRYKRWKLRLPRRCAGHSENMMLVGFYVPCSLHTTIDRVAKDAGLHKSDWLRNAILEKLNGSDK